MKKLVVLSGAGMSAESGISTFRGAGGLWDNYPVNDVATPQGFAKNPALVLDFYNQRRKQLLSVEPNGGHKGLVELESFFDVDIITQNVDNLHERAGSSKVLHLHGELMKVRSTGPGQEVFDVDPAKPEIHLGDRCPKGFQLRPHIVWFGEAVPEFERAAKIVSQADILVIIGTSMQVYPAASLINWTKPGIPVYLIDPNEVNIDNSVHYIQKGASEGVHELKKILLDSQ